MKRMCKFLTKIDHGLLAFCQEVERLSYSDKHDYKKLQAILHGVVIYDKQREFDKFILIQMEKEKMNAMKVKFLKKLTE